MAKYRIHVYHPGSDKSFPGDLVEYSRTEAYSHFLEIKAIVDQGLPLHFTQKDGTQEVIIPPALLIQCVINFQKVQ